MLRLTHGGVMITASLAKLKEHSHEYLVAAGPRKTVLNIPKGQIIFSQGDPADSIFYVQTGRVKISVTSLHGKEATLAWESHGSFIGEESIAGRHTARLATAVAIQPTKVLRIESREMTRALGADKSLADLFQSFLLSRCALMQADLIDHLFNSSEKRLARTLLLLAQLEDKAEAMIPNTTHETLAEMVGTTRSRISFFMNRFRKLEHIQYTRYSDMVNVRRTLFNILLQE
jgi:CRP/FNR family cyclic AMP-dependent transcriptional regulator